MSPFLFTNLFRKRKRQLFSCFFLFILSCNAREDQGKRTSAPIISIQYKDNRQQLADALALIRTGDMITRTGNDFTSLCLRQFCQHDKTYSHCGIASIEHDTVFVYHALGGEFNPGQALLRESLPVFVATEANHGFGVFRFEMDTAQTRKLISEAKNAYEKKISFDMKFDLSTDDKMYCSEFAAKMYRHAYDNDTMFSPVKTPALDYLAPDNLFTHPACRKLFAARY